MTPGLIGFERLSDAAPPADMVLGLMPDAAVMVVDSDHRVVVIQGAAYARHGHDPAARDRSWPPRRDPGGCLGAPGGALGCRTGRGVADARLRIRRRPQRVLAPLRAGRAG